MKKICTLLILLTITTTSFVGCAKASSDTVEDKTRMKVLNIKYVVEDSSVSDMKILCDTKTNLLYLTGLGNGGGFTPFNHLETNHDGDVVTKQYTLDEFQKEYMQTQSTKIQIK